MAQTTTERTANAVRAELARRRISGRDLALALGWSERTTRRRLGGEIPFSVEEISAVAAHLRLPLSSLLPDNTNSIPA